MKGTLANAMAVLAGTGVGLVIRRGIPEKILGTVMQGLGLAVLMLGLQMALQTGNVLIVLISMSAGGLVGEAINLDAGLNRLGDRLTALTGGGSGDAGKAFVTTTLMFCVGALAVVGSVQDGLTGDAATLYAKSVLDGIASVVLASSLGAGVGFSAVSILIYQGTITLMAGLFADVLSPAVVREMTAAGGLLIVGVGLSMLEIKTIRVANLLPAIPAAALLASFWSR